MAIYSLNLGFISRSAGRSSVGFSAYISGEKIQDARTGISYNYDCKNDVIVSRILAPEGAPEWAKTSSTLWNTVEQFEDNIASLRFRGDAKDPDKNQKSLAAKEHFLNSTQTAQTIMGALPIEFTQLEAETSVEEFLQSRFVSRGLIVEYAIHWDKGNPHFHGLITRRPLVEGPLNEGGSLSEGHLLESPPLAKTILEGTFSQRKDADIVTKAELLVTRKQWELVVNKHLELGGHEVRIDSRSYADQGVSFLPTHHEGWYAQRLAERGEYSRIVADNEAIRQKNIEVLCQDPSVLIHELCLKRTVFTRNHLEEEVLRRVGGDEKLFALLKAKVDGLEIPSELILNQANDNRDMTLEGTTELRKLAFKFTDSLLTNEDIIHRIGENFNRDPVFTLASYKKQEERILSFGEALHQRQGKSVAGDLIETSICNREEELGSALSDEQRQAIVHLCSGSDLRVLNGRAGTGKTTLLKAVARAYQDAGYRVLGTSFQGKAVEIMEQEIGITCKTLDSFKYFWEKHQKNKELIESGTFWGRPYAYALKTVAELEPHRLTDKDVIIVDEANMVGNRLWDVFLKEATEKGAKVLIVQDPAQIKSREPGDTGRLFAERFGFTETTEVVRQRIPWQRECSKLLNDHQVIDGLTPYYEKGNIQWFDNGDISTQRLTQDYIKGMIENPSQYRIVLAYRNSEVHALNKSIRQALLEKGYLGGADQHGSVQMVSSEERAPHKDISQEIYVNGEAYSLGDRIRFIQNDNHGTYVKNATDAAHDSSQSKGVKNGTFGTIEAYDEEQSLLTVCLDGNKLTPERRVSFNINAYPHIILGYAMGIHKSEGSTFDKSFVSFDPLMDPSTVLVSMTRHRQDVQVYVNREQFVDFKEVVEKTGWPSLNQTVQDYHVPEEQKPYFHRIQHYRDLIVEASTLREEMEGDPQLNLGSKESLGSSPPLYTHPSYTAYQTCFEEKKRVAEYILKEWQVHAPYVRLAGIRKDVLEVEAGLRPRLLSDLEHRASLQVQAYMDCVRETRSLWKTISGSETEAHANPSVLSPPGILAKYHPLYEEYQKHKVERDSLAAVMQETPRLYAPFFKVTKACTRVPSRDETSEEMTDYWGEKLEKEARVYFTAVKSHAAAHTKSQLQALFYGRLSPDQKTHYDEVKAYVNVRNEAAAVYSHIRKQERTSESYLETFRGCQAQRDALALKLVDAPVQHQDFFALLNVKEDKLLEHAVAGELREKVQAYVLEQDLSNRASQAQELKRILTSSAEYRIFKEETKNIENVDLNRLTFDMAFHDKVKSGECSDTLTPDQVYKPIQNYLKASKEVAVLWKRVQSNEQENVEVKKNWESALQARHDTVRVLMGDKVALAVMDGMGKKLQKPAHQQKPINQKDNPEDPSLTLTSRGAHPDGRNSELSPKEQENHRGLQKTLQQTNHFLPVSHILEATRGHTAEIAMDVLGSPNKSLSSKTALRFGTKGSFVITISGPKEGLWTDFESGTGGNIFQLVQREKGLSFKDSVSYLADVLNVSVLNASAFKVNALKVSPSLSKGDALDAESSSLNLRGSLSRDSLLKRDPSLEIHPQPQNLPHTSLSAPFFEEEKETEDIGSRLNSVSELQMKSKPIEGTIAADYLRKERGIQGPLSADLRYLPKGTTFFYGEERRTLQHDCLAAFGKNQDGRLQSVQLTKLTEEGKRALTSEGEKLNKLHYGVARGSFVTLQAGETTDRLFIAEGLETALSLKEAGIAGKIVASLGIHNISNYQGPEKEIILCGDNDDQKQHSQTHRVIEKTKAHFRDQGKSVGLIKPVHPGDDFNDVLKKEGIQGVQGYLKAYLDPDKQIQVQQRMLAIEGESAKQTLAQNTAKSPNPERSSLAHHSLTQTRGMERIDPSYAYSSSAATSSPSAAGKENPLDVISDYISEKLRDIKAYAGTSLANAAQQELKDYLQTLEKNTSLFEAIKDQNKDLSCELERQLKEQERAHQMQLRIKDRGMDLRM